MEKAPLQSNFTIPRPLAPYDKLLLAAVAGYGGFNNAHAHIDRADTIEDKYLRHIHTTPLEASSLPLTAKQNLTGDLHRGCAYTEADLLARMSDVIERQIAYGVTRLATCVDATSDIGEDGLLAIRVANELKEKFKDHIVLRIAPNPIFGFKEGTNRWEVFEAAARQSDFLSALPEKDDYRGLRERDGKIGFREHLRHVIQLGCELGKEVHIHLDQANDPEETGTETLIEGLRWLDQPVIEGQKGPSIWVIHMISPTAYDEQRYRKLIGGLLEHNLGVIICPTAALSMRQLRPIAAPTHNSIARVLEICKSGVPVHIGTDNICDVFVPQGDGDMLTEIKMCGHAVRLATPHVWAKLAAGLPLNQVDKASIGRVLYQDLRAFQGKMPDWQSAVD